MQTVSLIRLWLVVVAPAMLMAQTSAFEVASIKAVPPSLDGRISVRMSTDNNLLRYTNVTLKDIIAQAYEIGKYQVAGPDWMDNERYSIAAKIPDGLGSAQIPAMLKALLSERFGVKFHRESREMGVLALVAAKTGPKLTPAEKSTGCHMSNTSLMSHFTCQATLAYLAEQLTARQDRPVVDKTGLAGPFSIDLQWSSDSAVQVDTIGGATLLQALPEQLGLRLESQRGPVEMLVVDSALREPTEN